MSNVERFEYQGPDLVYKPQIGRTVGISNQRAMTINPTGGYHDLNHLHAMLNHISGVSRSIFTAATKILSKFSLKIDQSNVELKTAHELVYPDDETPGYITFDEYKFLLTAGDSNAVQLLRTYYESNLRGPKGIASLDYLLLAKAIHAEVERIRTFLETFVGELDETAEFRTVELFQDWAEDTTAAVDALRKAVSSEIATKLSQSELDKLDAELSAKCQVLFQTKLNESNKMIKEHMAQFEKNWNQPSDHFYNRVLGPALLFQVKVANALTDPMFMSQGGIPTIQYEISNGVSGLSQNYMTALEDQVQRNSNFMDYIMKTMYQIDTRDVYKNYIIQLEGKGKILSSPFIASSTVEQADAILDAPDPLDGITNPQATSTALRPSHFDLLDRFDDDAHPQYFPRSGGTIIGDVELGEGVKIDGIIPSQHIHNGVDGSEKISGSHIVPGTIVADNISTDSTTATPEDLAVTSQIALFDGSGSARFLTEVVFSVDTSANIVGYEFDIVKLS